MIDRFLISKVFEPATGWLIDTYGRTQYWASEQLLIGGAVFAFGIGIEDAVRNGLRPAMIYGWAGWIFFLATEYRENRQYRPWHFDLPESPIAQDPMNIVGRLWMLLNLCWIAPIGVLIIASGHQASLAWFSAIGAFLLFTSSQYFRACIGRPPREKQRQLQTAMEGA